MIIIFFISFRRYFYINFRHSQPYIIQKNLLINIFLRKLWWLYGLPFIEKGRLYSKIQYKFNFIQIDYKKNKLLVRFPSKRCNFHELLVNWSLPKGSGKWYTYTLLLMKYSHIIKTIRQNNCFLNNCKICNLYTFFIFVYFHMKLMK